MNTPENIPHKLQLLSVREAASMLGVSRHQIDRWTADNKLRFILVGRERRYPVWHLEDFERAELGITVDLAEKMLSMDAHNLTTAK